MNLDSENHSTNLMRIPQISFPPEFGESIKQLVAQQNSFRAMLESNTLGTKHWEEFARTKGQFEQLQQVAQKISLSAMMPPFDSIRTAIEASNKLSQSAFSIREMADSLRPNIEALAVMQRTIADFASQRAAIFDFSRISGIAELSARMIQASQPFRELENLRGLRASLANDFTIVSSQFTNLLQNVSAGFVQNAVSADNLFSLPSREYFASEELLEIVCPPLETDLELETKRDEIRTDIDFYTTSNLEKTLIKLNPSLVKLWSGANAAVKSQNPDKARHALVSARELATQVLHLLAPDQSVQQWNQSETFYDEKGRPTRRARLFYVCRNVNNEPLKNFVEKDILSVLALFDVLQTGTHGIDSNFSDKQLKMIFRRAESALCSLIEISDAIES